MATSGAALNFDEAKLNAFMERVVGDMGAAAHATLIVVGDKLGPYKTMAGAGPMTPAELAASEVVTAGGFTRFRRAAQTPFNIVFEARP